MAEETKDPLKRHYNCSDVAMLIAMGTIAKNALAHQTELVARKSAWAAPFFTNFQTAVDQVIQDQLGISSADALTTATDLVLNIQQVALDKLSDVRTQIAQGLRDNHHKRDQLFTRLGFTAHYQQAYRNYSQEALIALLTRFRQNVDNEQATLVNLMDLPLINEVKGYADQLIAANVNQEWFKTNRPNITAEKVTAFNGIYETGIAIAITAAHFTRKNKPVSQSFSFSRLVNAQRAALKSKKKPGNPPPDNTAQ